MTSTKFWITVAAIAGLTIIEGILVFQGNLDYTRQYFDVMIGIAVGFNGIKFVQNLALTGRDNNNGQGDVK